MHEYPRNPRFDSVNERRVNALAGFGFTQRQREFLVAVMVHAGCFLERQYCAFILAFAERVLPRASDLWVQASLDYKQRLQQLFFPEGIAYDGIRFNRTTATAPFFKYLAPGESAEESLVSRIFASWNQLDGWLCVVDSLRQVA